MRSVRGGLFALLLVQGAAQINHKGVCTSLKTAYNNEITVAELNACLQRLGALFYRVQYIEVQYGQLDYLTKMCEAFGMGEYDKPIGGDECTSGGTNQYPSHCRQGWLGKACWNGCGNPNYLSFSCTGQAIQPTPPPYTGPPTTTTTTTTTTTSPPYWATWVKGRPGENCMVTCGGEDKCLDNQWPTSVEAFRDIAKNIGGASCESVEPGDWDVNPGIYVEFGNSCYWQVAEDRRDNRCGATHYAVARYCPCDVPAASTGLPLPPTSPPKPDRSTTTVLPTTPSEPSPRERCAAQIEHLKAENQRLKKLLSKNGRRRRRKEGKQRRRRRRRKSSM